MKGKPVIFILKVLVLSIILFILWYWKGETCYLPVLEDFLRKLSWTLGIRKGGLPYPRYILSNLIPFVSLMLITREIEFKKRILRLVTGLLILIAGHILLGIGIYLLCQDSPTPQTICYKLSILLHVFSGTLPFFLWVILAKKNLLTLSVPKKGELQSR
jgi:hypothetical protein